jgi:hypothetical protein
MVGGQHGRPGVALTELRQVFERLVARGVSNSEACRVVGINRRTGTRWRYGRAIATGRCVCVAQCWGWLLRSGRGCRRPQGR